MKDMLDEFHAANPWDGLDWDRESVTFVQEDAPGGVIELTITIADAGADGRVYFETEVRQGDVIHTMREDADAIKDLLPNTVWPYALANGYGLKTFNADMAPYNAITSVLDMFAYSEKMRVFEQIERTIRDLDKLLYQNWGALSREFKLHNPRVALWDLHYFCKNIVQSDARGWEGYHLSNANKAIWRALDIFDEMDESDKEALGDGFLDDLHTALTPIEQIANGDYFVN
jgi:hypothetical protein